MREMSEPATAVDHVVGRSYGQYCGLARALDVVGGRWSLLIVRELLVGPARFSELRTGLPGIATNLLVGRLRELGQAGVIQRGYAADSNVIHYSLTPWGEELRGAVAALVNWSTPLMVSGPGNDVFRTSWLAVALDALLDNRHIEESATVGIVVDGATVTVRSGRAGTRVTLGDDAEHDAVLQADVAVVLGLSCGLLSVEQAISLGGFRGDARKFGTVFESPQEASH